MVKQVVLIAACIAGFGLQACSSSAVDPAKVEADVQKAQAEGEKKVVDAKAKLEQVNAENNRTVVDAQADARLDAAKADDGAKATDAAKKTDAASKADAGAALLPPAADPNVAKARVAALEKAADAEFGLDKAKAEATHAVTMARCGGQSSTNMQTVCKDGAQKALDSAVAAAKARNDAARRRAAMLAHNTTDGQSG